MITKDEIKKYINEHQDNLNFMYVEDVDAIYNKETNKFIAPFDEYYEVFKRHAGQSFEGIYYEHCSLLSVIRCNVCGTVIFSYDDERYEPNLSCPICTDYKTDFEFWTKEQIDSDVDKQNEIEFLKKMAKEQEEMYQRRKRRKGKYDWEIAEKKFYGKKRFLSFALECTDITKSYFKGLKLIIRTGKKIDDIGYAMNKNIVIPLSWHAFYIHYIFKHTKNSIRHK